MYQQQYGTRTTVVPRNDLSTLRGQFDLQTVYRFVSEGYAGYHWDWLHGVNVDLGIFMSYVGLFSYDNFENWAYQPSYTSDNTPWFFNGARIQIFPTDRLKIELWIVNGWQTYGKFNETPGLGWQIRWAPVEWINSVSNEYFGGDTQDHPGRWRFHSDNSFLMRYYNRPNSNGLSRAAYSVTFDLGFEQGDGVAAFSGNGKEGSCTNATPCEQDFISGMAYNRLWFWRNQIGVTVGGGFIHNPGRYLVLIPTGVAGALFDGNPGTKWDGWDCMATLDYMPTENLTLRFELVSSRSELSVLQWSRRCHWSRWLQKRRSGECRRSDYDDESTRLDARPVEAGVAHSCSADLPHLKHGDLLRDCCTTPKSPLIGGYLSGVSRKYGIHPISVSLRAIVKYSYTTKPKSRCSREDWMRVLAVPSGGGGPMVSPQSRLAGLSILLVEDDDDIREVLEMNLASLGATVVSARSARDARASLRQFNPDLLLSDIFMPGEDGVALLISIRQMARFRGIQAVAITAATLDTPLRSRLLDAGFQAVLAKPFHIDQLEHAIHQLVRAA